jgi:hypothetical protein
MPGRKPAKTVVASATPMLQLQFRQHVMKRHPRMRFITKNEHDQDHRIHIDELDHVHEEDETTEEADAPNEGA